MTYSCVSFRYTGKGVVQIVLFQILFHWRLLQDIGYSCLRYTVGPCCCPI